MKNKLTAQNCPKLRNEFSTHADNFYQIVLTHGELRSRRGCQRNIISLHSTHLGKGYVHIIINSLSKWKVNFQSCEIIPNLWNIFPEYSLILNRLFIINKTSGRFSGNKWRHMNKFVMSDLGLFIFQTSNIFDPYGRIGTAYFTLLWSGLRKITLHDDLEINQTNRDKLFVLGGISGSKLS